MRVYESFEMGMKVPYSGLVPLFVDDEHLVDYSSVSLLESRITVVVVGTHCSKIMPTPSKARRICYLFYGI